MSLKISNYANFQQTHPLHFNWRLEEGILFINFNKSLIVHVKEMFFIITNKYTRLHQRNDYHQLLVNSQKYVNSALKIVRKIMKHHKNGFVFLRSFCWANDKKSFVEHKFNSRVVMCQAVRSYHHAKSSDDKKDQTNFLRQTKQSFQQNR